MTSNAEFFFYLLYSKMFYVTRPLISCVFRLPPNCFLIPLTNLLYIIWMSYVIYAHDEKDQAQSFLL